MGFLYNFFLNLLFKPCVIFRKQELQEMRKFNRFTERQNDILEAKIAHQKNQMLNKEKQDIHVSKRLKHYKQYLNHDFYKLNIK